MRWNNNVIFKTSNLIYMKPLELKGRKFERLLVVDEVDRGVNLKWLCQCDCGNKKIVRGADLNRGFIKSCGCWNSEVTSERNKTHGLAHTRFYRTWQSMKNRCLNPQNSRYRYYGGRGVGIDKSWLDFEKFKEDMFQSYEKHVKEFGEKNSSIDRINNNGNYKITNCRWATQKEQVNNSRKVLR